MQGELPSWWRSYWAYVAFAIAALEVFTEHFGMLIPSLVACGVACFGFEYLARSR
jgi:hypothetical protein